MVCSVIDHLSNTNVFIDPVVTPEHFAQTLIEDYNLAPTYHAIITKSIQDQLSDFKAHTVNYDGDEGENLADPAAVTLEDIVMKGRLDDEGNTWWRAWRKRLRTDSLDSIGPVAGKTKKRRKALDVKANTKDKSLTIDEFDIDEQALHEEMRILIKVISCCNEMRLRVFNDSVFFSARHCCRFYEA